MLDRIYTKRIDKFIADAWANFPQLDILNSFIPFAFRFG